MKGKIMRVFLTGSTGLLGGNLIQELQNEKHQVTALVRSLEKSGQYFNSEVNLVEGNMLSVSNFEHGLKDVDVLIHAAACYSEFYKKGNPNLPQQVNVQGTIDLFESAYKQGTRNIVYISSAGVLETNIGSLTDESNPYDNDTKDPYFRSKIEAEKEIYRFMESHPEMRIVFILPTAMLGPGDRGPTPSGQFIINALKGKVKFLLPGSMKIVDVRDVAKAIVSAIQKGQSSERYLIGGRQYPISQILQTISEITRKPAPSKSISQNKIILVARIMQIISKITGKPPELKVNIVKRLLRNFWYDSSKAEKEFGIQFRPLKDTLTDTVQWFQSNKRD